MKPLLFIDIDGTLIYSHRRAIDVPKRCIELLNGKEQSYITEKTFEYFKTQQEFEVIPITTRTVTQFDRLKGLLSDLGLNKCLVENGARLFLNGAEEPHWRMVSMSAAERTEKQMKMLLKFVQREYGEDAVIYHDSYMFYFKPEEPVEAFKKFTKHYKKMREQISPDTPPVFAAIDRTKVYCISSLFDKYSAALRYCQITKTPEYYAAGDSVFDGQLLRHAKKAFCPPEIAEFLGENKIVCGNNGEVFSDSVINNLKEIV